MNTGRRTATPNRTQRKTRTLTPSTSGKASMKPSSRVRCSQTARNRTRTQEAAPITLARRSGPLPGAGPSQPVQTVSEYSAPGNPPEGIKCSRMRPRRPLRADLSNAFLSLLFVMPESLPNERSAGHGRRQWLPIVGPAVPREDLIDSSKPLSSRASLKPLTPKRSSATTTSGSPASGSPSSR